MQLFELIILAVGLAMDAFAVSICKGLATGKPGLSGALTVGIWFGGFQALMPVLGYLVGRRFQTQIRAADHWIAFALLAFIGLNMIREALSKEEKTGRAFSADMGARTMFLLAVATSIDALAIGVTLAILGTKIALPATVIGCFSFGISAVGFLAGAAFGAKRRKIAQLAGGLILIAIGAKILIEHLMLGR